MAIDHRILSQIGIRDNSSILNIFNNALKNKREEPLRLLQEQAQMGQANELINQQEQAVANRPQQQLLDQQAQTQQIAVGYAQSLQPLLAAGNTPALITQLQKNKARLTQLGIPTTGVDEDIIQAQTPEGIEQLRVEVSQTLRPQTGQGQSAGQREFQNLLNIAQNPNSTEIEKNSANRKLGNLARVGSSAGERIATDPTLGAQVASQAGAEETEKAQAKSDVAVDEAKRLEEETEGGRQAIESKRLNIDETKITNEKKREEAISAKNSRRAEADSAVEQVASLLNGDRFTAAFGKLVTNTPDIAKSQKSLDAIADVDQIKGLLTLESRQKLKGQGTISDGEQKILAQSATVLNNPLISDERARRELRKIRGVFEAASDRNQLKRETKERPTVIRFDAQGNQIQ